MYENEFRDVLDDNEIIVWSGKPHFFIHIMSGVPFLIFGLLWGSFDLFFFKGFSSTGGPAGFIIPFLLLHSAPFWLSVSNMIRLLVTHKNTCFAITNKRILTKTGFMGIDYKTKDFERISHVEVNVSPLEKILGRGTVLIDELHIPSANSRRGLRGNRIYGIEHPYDVFKKLKSMSLDIKTDIHFPNKYRPDSNPGYNTKYDKE